MKYSIVLKFAAIALAACALVTMVGSAMGVVLLEGVQLYSTDYESWEEQRYANRAEGLAICMAESYAARNLSDLPQEHLTWIDWGNSFETISGRFDMDSDTWSYSICDAQGNVLEGDAPENNLQGYAKYEILLTVDYPVQASQLDGRYEGFEFWVDGAYQEIFVKYVPSEEYQVTVWIEKDSITNHGGLSLRLFEQLAGIRYYLIAGVAVGLMVLAICAVYLCCAAGRSPQNAELCPGGLNRLPLDVYAAAVFGICLLLIWLVVEVVGPAVYDNSGYNVGALALGFASALLVAVTVVGFFFAVAAQVKVRGLFWLRRTVIGWCLCKLWQGIRFVCRGFGRLFGLLPLIWQYLLIGAGMGIGLFLALVIAMNAYAPLLLILAVAVWLAIVCYGAYAYGTLLKGAKRMTEGNLYTKIPTKYLIGSYKKCAEHLNDLADVATVAAKNQMKSERMKTELITNVSHDIKTPLTSIINYVDLLQKPHSEAENAQYLEVLGRQSQRLKKLIEDLMEMSKATTGNMAVDITQVDAAEAVNQALGEFADKLSIAQLTPVFRQPEGVVAMLADGRLTWRVLSNLLSNIVKYALPGTRVYIDLVQREGQVLISLKNISREELNVTADELTERFVRGDASRNTEGSGLGLNIAKSLMELQKGQLRLLIDGDLFKVTLVFPAG